MFKKALNVFAKIFNFVVRAGTIMIILMIATYSIILPYVFHEQPYVVLSSSMEPTIHVGAVAVIDFKDKDIEEGDIITYRMDSTGSIETGNGEIEQIRSGLLVTHRVVDIRDGAYITKGDNNEKNDFVPVYPYQVIGTYKWNVPGLGYTLTSIAEMRTRIFIIGIIITLNLAAMMFNIATEDDDAEVKEEKVEKDSSPDKEEEKFESFQVEDSRETDNVDSVENAPEAEAQVEDDGIS